jgi:hypothetical protein
MGMVISRILMINIMVDQVVRQRSPELKSDFHQPANEAAVHTHGFEFAKLKKCTNEWVLWLNTVARACTMVTCLKYYY